MESAFIPWKKCLSYTGIAIVALFVYQFISSPLVITVTGVGEVSAKAKTATLTLSLVSNKDNLQEATSEIKNKITKIKETLKTSGIPESDIYESSITVYPASVVTAGAGGFQATSSMGIKTNQINNLDGITAGLYSLGAAVVTQPVLSVGDNKALENEAYGLALKDAKLQANSIALKHLKILKKIVLIQESVTSPTSTVISKADTISQIEKNLSPDDGMIKISKVLSVSYKMW